jgi:hypothetical protein
MKGIILDSSLSSYSGQIKGKNDGSNSSTMKNLNLDSSPASDIGLKKEKND